MLTLRCSRLVWKLLDLPAALPDPPASSGALGDWYVHLVPVEHGRVVLATSQRSLLTVLLPESELGTRLPQSLRAAVGELLGALKLPRAAIRRELAAMEPVAFGRSTDRRVLGSMRRMAFTAGIHLARGADLPSAARRLAGGLMSALAARPADYGCPGEVAWELLAPGQRGAPQR